MRLFVEAVLIGAAFVAGKQYGKAVEAKAIAFALRLETYGSLEFGVLYNKIKTIESKALDRIKKFL